MIKKKAVSDKDLTIDGNEIYIVVEGDEFIFKEAILPGCRMAKVNPYMMITDDGRKHITIQFERKRAK